MSGTCLPVYVLFGVSKITLSKGLVCETSTTSIVVARSTHLPTPSRNHKNSRPDWWYDLAPSLVPLPRSIRKPTGWILRLRAFENHKGTGSARKAGTTQIEPRVEAPSRTATGLLPGAADQGGAKRQCPSHQPPQTRPCRAVRSGAAPATHARSARFAVPKCHLAHGARPSASSVRSTSARRREGHGVCGPRPSRRFGVSRRASNGNGKSNSNIVPRQVSPSAPTMILRRRRLLPETPHKESQARCCRTTSHLLQAVAVPSNNANSSSSSKIGGPLSPR